MAVCFSDNRFLLSITKALAQDQLRALRELAERHADGKTSMGMSGDFEVAIEEGATWIRVGSMLFAGAAAEDLRTTEVNR